MDEHDIDIDALEDDFDLEGFREKRLKEIYAELQQKQALREKNHGQLTEIRDEKELMQTVAKSKSAVIHFYHKDFRRCSVMDSQLQKVAEKQFNTLFLKADVANVPFLVVKLEIKVLPCIICFIDGISKDRITGFEGLTQTDSDSFTAAQLEMRLSECGEWIHTRSPNTSYLELCYAGLFDRPSHASIPQTSKSKTRRRTRGAQSDSEGSESA